jgi:hypothetical protein
MVAAADDQPGLPPDAGEVLHHHDDLHIQLAMARDIEQIARDDHEVVVGGNPQEPVELPEAVVQIGDHQGLHANRVDLG